MEIRKINNRVWKFIDSEVGEFSPSKFTINELNNEITIVYFNNLRSKTYDVTEVELYDIGALSPFTTNSGIALMVELEALNCPCFQKDETNIYGSGSVVWGGINGTLSDQTDLKNALDLNVKKSEAQSFTYPSITGTDAVIPLPANGASTIIVNNAHLISISGFDLSLITGDPSAENPYHGKEYTLENQTNNNITLKHLSSVSIKFFALDQTDLIIPPGKSVRFNYGSSLVKETFKNWSSQKYKTISSNTTLDNTFHNAIVWVIGNCNITIPSGLRSDFACTLRTFTGVTATYLTSGTTINSESDGNIQAESSMVLIATYSTNNFILSGGGLS